MSQQSAVPEGRARRSTNFSNAERRLLLQLANSHHLVENKKTDFATTAAKNKAWESIEAKFNSKALGQFRDVKSLKNKYEAIKRELRKTDRSWMLTGGGPSTANRTPLAEEEIILLDKIAISYKGCAPTPGDSDLSHAAGLNPDGTTPVEDEEAVEDVDMNWEHYSPAMLRTRKPQELVAMDDFRVLDDLHVLEDPSSLQQAVVIDISAPPSLIPTPEISQGGVESPAAVDPVTPSPSRGSIVSRRRPMLRKRSMTSASAKFEELATKKLELVELLKRNAQHAERFWMLQIEKAEVDLQLSRAQLSKFNQRENGLNDE